MKPRRDNSFSSNQTTSATSMTGPCIAFGGDEAPGKDTLLVTELNTITATITEMDTDVTTVTTTSTAPISTSYVKGRTPFFFC